MSNSTSKNTHIWLLANSRSGNNDQDSIDLLTEQFTAHGLTIERTTFFPEEDLPSASALDDAGISRLAIFTGDGTLNAAITNLYGWGGEIIVLPGGTKNLLSNRLHGSETGSDEIITRIVNRAYRTVRLEIARCAAGDALAGLLIGPGTAWANVREAMRDFDLTAMAQETGAAMTETTQGAMVRCIEPTLGRNEGYPLIQITPSHRGMQMDAFYADEPSELLQQVFALIKRQFRDGPHERLGLVDEVLISSEDGSAITVLIDGEPAELGPEEKFSVVTCEVDLLATDHGY